MKKTNETLLIDLLYRQTFNKPGDPQLRQLLTSARRCVLSDEMAAFLYTLEVEVYQLFRGRKSRQSHIAWIKRIHGRLDDCRHFSRLPHRITWVEYALRPMLEREIAIRANTDNPYEDANDDGTTPWKTDLDMARAAKTRIGWLFQQHDKIETAFMVEYFLGAWHYGKGEVAYPQWAVVWDTENGPLPWSDCHPGPIEDDKYITEYPSAFVADIPKYDRINVGLRPMPPRPVLFSQPKLNNLQSRGRMFWCFLSTFNKVPIIGQHDVSIAHGFMARGGYHKYLDHKVLTINIPEKAGIRKVARQALALIRRRAHMVRGHWRDDWHLPKGNKSLWIAEHQRGDASLGFVLHDYDVQHNEK